MSVGGGCLCVLCVCVCGVRVVCVSNPELCILRQHCRAHTNSSSPWPSASVMRALELESSVKGSHVGRAAKRPTLEHVTPLHTERMKLTRLSTPWDIFRFKNYVMFLFKGLYFSAYLLKLVK